VDSPELNLPLARVLKSRGVAVLQYVGPQVWAWRPGRLNLLRERTDHVALILPFEKEIYDRAGVSATFVGHPLLDEAPAAPRTQVRRMLHVGENTPVIALLPGSRKAEVGRLAQPMFETAMRLLKMGMCPVFAPSPVVAHGDLMTHARGVGCAILPPGLRARDLLGASDAALAASGTVTLEAVLEDVPLGVVYKMDALSFAAARRLVRIPHVGLPNILAGKMIVSELLQEKASPFHMVALVENLLEQDTAKRQRNDYMQLRKIMGAPSGAPGVALAVCNLLIGLMNNRRTGL
jgi:lipid-A-disaccharide synthase